MNSKWQHELIFFVKWWLLIMFLTYFGNENFSLSRIEILYRKSGGMEIRIAND